MKKLLLGIALGLSSLTAQAEEFKIEAYKPNYVIRTQGIDENNMRFQVSFMSKILGPLKFSYTQRAIWRVWDYSAPITDMDFNPSLFVGYKNLEMGYEHESNGMTSDDSRSWDRIYFYTSYDLDQIQAGYKFWIPFFVHENRDMTDYQGTMELFLKMKVNQFEFRNTTRIKNNLMEVEWDLGDFNLYAQAFNGFGKHIKEYDREAHYYGFGISL